MKSYQSKQSLLEEIERTYQLFIAEFDEINPEDYDVRLEGIDKTPREMIAYQIGWLTLLPSWDADELAGKPVITPTPDYKWNNLGGLYQDFYKQCAEYDTQSLKDVFQQRKQEFTAWVLSLDTATLFEPEQRQWATTAAKWPVWKWVHINSVAPFTNFRATIRKWKRSRARS